MAAPGGRQHRTSVRCLRLRSGFLDHVIRLLLAAAESGKRADINAATEQLEHLLRDRRLM
jgi:hypothetical protein